MFFLLLVGHTALPGCAFLDARRWTESLPSSRAFNSGYRAEPFRPAIEACVAAHDPQHLFELGNGGTYESSESLGNAAEIRAVKTCMSEKGWLNVPAVNLGP